MPFPDDAERLTTLSGIADRWVQREWRNRAATEQRLYQLLRQLVLRHTPPTTPHRGRDRPRESQS